MFTLFLPAVLSLGALGLFFGLVLGLAAKKFAVKIDPRIEKVLKALPGSNCGACGLAGCCGFAESVVAGESEPVGCAPGGAEVAEHLANILGVEVKITGKKIARLICGGDTEKAQEKFIYQGVHDCRAGALLFGGNKACSYGCLGLGSCAEVCPFEAIHISEQGLPVINASLCTGCAKCVLTCPREVLTLLPEQITILIACRSEDKGKQVKEACKVGCIGCGICVKVCPPKAITLVDNLARIDYNKCDNCGACVEKCPTKCIIKV